MKTKIATFVVMALVTINSFAENLVTTTMANDPTALPRKDAADTELALWMLERMRDSDGFLGVIRAAHLA